MNIAFSLQKKFQMSDLFFSVPKIYDRDCRKSEGQLYSEMQRNRSEARAQNLQGNALPVSSRKMDSGAPSF